jgi:hypothetical protein
VRVEKCRRGDSTVGESVEGELTREGEREGGEGRREESENIFGNKYYFRKK